MIWKPSLLTPFPSRCVPWAFRLLAGRQQRHLCKTVSAEPAAEEMFSRAEHLSFPCSDKVTGFIATVNLRLLNSGKLEDPKSEIVAQNDGARIRTQISFPSIMLPLFSVNLLHSFATKYKTEMKKLILLVPKASKSDRGSP